MANYQTIPVSKPKSSKQKNTVFSVGTSDFGRLQPVGTFEVVPGDKIELDMRSFVRAALLLLLYTDVLKFIQMRSLFLIESFGLVGMIISLVILILLHLIQLLLHLCPMLK